MKKILFCLLILICFGSLAQNNSSSFDWSFNGGGGQNFTERLQYNSQGDLLFLMRISGQTTYGGVLVTEPGIGTNPGNTTFIGKRTQSGISSVVIKINTPNNTGTNFQDFVIDSNDNIIVTGGTFGFDNTVFYNFGNGITLYGKGNFIAKFNPQGVCQWANLINYNITTGNAAENKNIALGILPNNDIYFANISNNGSKPFWLIKYNTAGVELWHKEWLFPSSASIQILSSKNNFFFDNTGKAYFYIYNANGTPISVDGVALTPPAGTHPTTCSLLTINNDGTNGVFTTYRGIIGDIAVEKTSGNILINWQQYGANPAPFNTLPQIVLGNSAFQGIVALDSNRNFINTAGIQNAAQVESIFSLGNLNFVTNGRMVPNSGTKTILTQSFTPTKHTPTWVFYENLIPKKFVAHPEINGSSGTSYDFMAIYGDKLAVSGKYRLANNPTLTINGSILTSCVQDPNYATQFPIYASLQRDVFISQLTLDQNFLSSNSIKEIANISVYPNPTNSKLNFNLSNPIENATLKLISLTGQTVLEKQNLNGIDFNFDVSNLNSGLYLLQISDGQYSYTSKFVKQ